MYLQRPMSTSAGPLWRDGSPFVKWTMVRGGVVGLLNDGRGLDSRTLVVKKDSHELQVWTWLAPTQLLKFGELWRIKAQG